MRRILGVLALVTAVYAVLATLSFVGAVASGLPAGMWVSVTIYLVWFASSALLIAGLLLIIRNHYIGLVLKPSSFALSAIGCILAVQAVRAGGYGPLLWWMILIPTLLAVLCAVGSLALNKGDSR